LGAALPRRRRWGIESTEAIGFHFEVSLDVVVGGGGASMPQPKGYYLQSDSSLDQVKGGGVPESVGRYRACAEGGAVFRGDVHRPHESEFDSDPSEWSASPIGKQRLVRFKLMRPAPLLNESTGLWPEGNLSVLAPFAVEAYDLAIGVAGLKLNDLRNPGAGIIHEREQHPVAAATPSRVVERGENGGDLSSRHEPDCRLGATFKGNRLEALAKDEVIGPSFCENEVDETADRCQPCITGRDRIAPLGLEVVEKGEHGLGREAAEVELVNAAMVVIGKKPKQ